MRQVLCPVLVGRDAQLSALIQAAERATAGSGSLVLVTGEAGAGKSRLVRELSGWARARNALIVAGRAVQGSARVPYRPLSEAVLGLPAGRAFDDPELRPYRPALGRLLPEWQPIQPVPGSDSPVLVGEGLRRLLRVASGPRLCVLAVEDLHWADPESLAVLEYLADHLATDRILCVATLRPEQDSPGTELMRSLLGRRAVRVVEVDRLDRRTTVELARACVGGAALPAEAEAYLAESADGLPFLVEELLASLVNDGALVERDGRWCAAAGIPAGVPPTLADAVGRRLAELSADGLSVLHAAAMLGRRFDSSLLPAVSGLDQAVVRTELRRAVRLQLLAVSGAEIVFRHALTRDAVLADLLPPERVELADRALAAVEADHPDPSGGWCELAAELAEQAGRPRRAVELLLLSAARAATSGALATAEATLRHAATLAALVGDGAGALDLTARVEIALTDVYAQSGQVDRAFELGAALLARSGAFGPSGERAALHLRLARAAVTSGRWSLAADHVAAARSAASHPSGGQRAEAGALEAQLALAQGRLTDAEQLALAALTAAERAGLPATACEALEVIGRVTRQRDLDDAEQAFARELATASAHGLALWRLRALHELGTLDQLRTESVDRLMTTRGLALDLGAHALLATLDLQIAAGLLKQFRTADGLAAAQRSAETSRRLRLSTLPMALVYEATAYAQRRQEAQMEAKLADAVAQAPDDLDVLGCVWGHCRATVSLLVDDRVQALERMARGVRILQQSPATIAPPFLGLYVLLLACAGQDEQAAREAARVRSSEATRHRIVASLLGYADAVTLGRAGHTDDAGRAHAAADREMGPLVSWYRHYARRLTAEAALADGWGEPVAWLREANAFFTERGDAAVAAGCREQLRRAGVPVPRAGRGDAVVPEHLRGLGVTSREVDVLTLVSEGLTNAELASRLHLSPRTVEKHVAALLAKTGCRRRAELAAYAARLSGRSAERSIG